MNKNCMETLNNMQEGLLTGKPGLDSERETLRDLVV